MSISDMTALELGRRIQSGDITAVQAAEASLARIKAMEPSVHAFVTVNEEKTMEQAGKVQADIEAGRLKGPLAGVPVAIKDNMCTKGMRTTCSSRILGNFIPTYTAQAVSNLEQAGAVILGKTNMDEFAMGGSTETSYFKKTKNAWDQTKVPGGSSGGSASAVAAGQVPVSLGSDTGGSIRQPAAFNGIVGLKPTYGRVSRFGLIAFASSLDQIGPLTRNVKDNALALNAISGYDEKDGTSAGVSVPDFTADLTGDIKGMKIALPKEYLGEGVQPDVREAVLKAAETFKSLGATVEEVSLPHSKYGVAVYYIIASSEASSNLQRFDGIRYGYRSDNVQNLEDVYVNSRSEGFGTEVKRRIMLGTFSLSAGYYDAHFKKAGQVRTLIKQDFENVFADYDLIIGPSTPTVAFGLGENINDPITMYMNDILTIPVNLAGLPGMSIPAGFSEGLPVGLQIIGKHFDEHTMYKAAYAFEQATDFHTKKPVILGGND